MPMLESSVRELIDPSLGAQESHLVTCIGLGGFWRITEGDVWPQKAEGLMLMLACVSCLNRHSWLFNYPSAIPIRHCRLR